MSFEVLATIVVINAVVTFSLWRKLVTKGAGRPRLNKKAAKKLWHSEPIVPRHDPPKLDPSLNEDDRPFFTDFKDFADVVNASLAEEFTASRFRLQDLPDDTVMLNVSHDSGPVYGRCFALYYNQTRIGRLEVHPAYKYGTEAPEVYTSVEIDWARFIGFTELTEFLGTIAQHVGQNPKGHDHIAAWQSINRALTETLWGSYRISRYDHADDEDWGQLSLSFQGTAAFYVACRDAPARVRTAGANAPRNERSENSNVSDKHFYKRNTAIVLGGLAFLLLLGFILTLN